jgi:hypothetical protein
MAEHRQLPTELDSYELREVYAPLGPEGETVKALRITIHGRNIFMRALEPAVRVGNVEVQYPEIQVGERSIAGFLPRMPPEGSEIVLEYDGEPVARLRERFNPERLRRAEVDPFGQ